MIVIDSSALIAILEDEPEQDDFTRLIFEQERRLLSAVTYQEAGQVVFARRGSGGVEDLDELLNRMNC